MKCSPASLPKTAPFVLSPLRRSGRQQLESVFICVTAVSNLLFTASNIKELAPQELEPTLLQYACMPPVLTALALTDTADPMLSTPTSPPLLTLESKINSPQQQSNTIDQYYCHQSIGILQSTHSSNATVLQSTHSSNATVVD